MPNNAGTFELVALELSRAISPLAGRLHDTHHAVGFLAELGLKLPSGSVTSALETTFEQIHTAAHSLQGLTQDLITAISTGSNQQIIAKGVALAQQVAALIDAFDMMGGQLGALGAVPGIDPNDLAQFSAGLPKRLFETALIEYFEGFHRIPQSVLEFVGVFDKTRLNVGSTDHGKPEFLKKELRLDRIGMLLQSPDQLLKSLYGWGDPGFDGNLMVRRIAGVLRSLGIPVTSYQLPGTPPRQAIEVCVFSLAPTNGVSPPGLEAGITRTISDGVTFDLPFASGWLAHLGAEGSLSAAAGIQVLPPGKVKVVPPSGSAQGRLKAGIAAVPVVPTPTLILLGVAGGTRLTAEKIGFNVLSGFRWDSAASSAAGDFGFEGEISHGKLRIGMDEADGFIGKMLSGVSLEADFNLGFGWTANRGVYFTGSSTLEIQLPVHISLGPVDLDALTLRVGIDGGRFPIGLTTNIKVSLGPLIAVVEGIGAGVELSFPADGRGSIGPLDLSFRFQPPRGAGLSLDAGVVKGGGYVFFDPDRGEYAGILELALFEVVTIKAIGIITTKMPDGSNGFSLLIIMSVEFGAGIQLGFGFTLVAVGGLIGVNRTMKLQALADGIRSGAVESVMFPRDIIANAPKIISDLRTFFPPQEGKFLIGPMVKLGWGTPTLVSLSLGIIIEIPGNIAILGILQLALPTSDAAIIKLQVNFIGAIEFDRKRVWFFASLFDSRVVFLTIDGEMGLLMAFGDDANFVVSVGGFHPRFSPPPLPFPSPRRIAVSILNTPVARIRVEGYFAVTSNTAQFGSRTEVFFGLDEVNVQGHLAFDALFQFSPFYFVIDISASFSVNVFGAGLFSVSLSGTLEGPAPWHIEGHGSISILFWDVGIDFSETWGENRKEELLPVPVLPMLESEFGKAENWLAFLPAGVNLFVTIRKMPEAEAELILHPVGVLRVSQRAVPLEIKLDKIGSRKPSDVNRLVVGATNVPGGLIKKADVFEKFAPAQFQNYSDAEKLSRPAFGLERSGIELSAGGEAVRSSKMVRRVVLYEEIIIDNQFKRFRHRFRGFLGALFELFLNGSAVSRCDRSFANARKFQPFEEKISVTAETYTVALQANNKAFAAESASFQSEASAREYLARQVAADPSLADQIHVLPSFEMSP